MAVKQYVLAKVFPGGAGVGRGVFGASLRKIEVVIAQFLVVEQQAILTFLPSLEFRIGLADARPGLENQHKRQNTEQKWKQQGKGVFPFADQRTYRGGVGDNQK